MGKRTTTIERAAARELIGFRQVFETWWIGIPVGFEETWVDDGGYWHAWDADRSVSMSSTVLREPDGRAVATGDLEEHLAPMLDGEPIDDVPPDLVARATVIDTVPPSRASRAVTGWVVAEGRVLIATITSDDLDWARETWRSIGYRPAPLPAAAAQRPGTEPPCRRRPGWHRTVH
jgi:hypothetical protein